MAVPLRLTLTDYQDPTSWRWVLSEGNGKYVKDHVVNLDPKSREYGGFLDLSSYVDYHSTIQKPEQQLAELGKWIGENVFGGLRDAFWRRRSLPAAAVQVIVPEKAQALLFRPLELATLKDGKSLRAAGIRFVYELEGETSGTAAKDPVEKAVRILAAFSLPVRANPLNLRRERYGLQRLVRRLNREQGLAVELRVLQYGASRETLREALEEAEGWDVIQLSGHGNKGELLLEDERGGSDTIDADELGSLLDQARARLKLLVLDACFSGAGSHEAAREQFGLGREPTRQEEAQGEPVPETAPTALPSLAQQLAGRLDCAALAMRYPVGDDFATDLMLALYEKLLEKRQTLPAALHLALDHALKSDVAPPPLSPTTPILMGVRAAELRLAPPSLGAESFSLPKTSLSIGFSGEPERFVGRLQPMLRASQALAPASATRAVLFHGMPGAGKTSCALELAYRHEHGRFRGYVWHKAPEAGSDIATALLNLMQDIQTQLDEPGLGLTMLVDQPEQFQKRTLPRLTALLKTTSLLLVLDNLETLLTESDSWRDPLWGEVLTALVAHDGPSRVVLTSRRVPVSLANQPRVHIEPIHALSFAESVLLARELKNLRRLFEDAAGRTLLFQTLRVVQGHPKLMELANGLAADRAALAARVSAASSELADRSDLLDAFFAAGVPKEGETQQSDTDFVRSLQGWTIGVSERLPQTARLLFAFLCRMEPEDRRKDILDAIWKSLLKRLGADHAVAAAALAEKEDGLPAALDALEAVGLIGVERPANDAEMMEKVELLVQDHPELAGLDPAAVLAGLVSRSTTYSIHPGVAEAARGAAHPSVLAAADIELGDYHGAMFNHGVDSELEGGGGIVVESARRAAPYLLRQARWQDAGALLEHMLHRDDSPDSLAFALPLLSHVAERTEGTEEGLGYAGVFAKALARAGRTAEAEGMMRDLVTRAVSRGNHRVAGAVTCDLCELLMSSGRLEEALEASEEGEGYARLVRLGPWTQLFGASQRLKVMVLMGRNDEVLAEVEALRSEMDALPQEDGTEEAVDAWDVGEMLLSIGLAAASNIGRWETALALNSEVVKLQTARGANELEIARCRFNDYGPLLSLGRFTQARALLTACRSAFESERDIAGLGRVYTALADLEDKIGGGAQAVRFQEVALGYAYQARDPELCSVSHSNLSNYLERRKAEPDVALAHRLAAACMRYQTGSGLLAGTLSNLAATDLPSSPPRFADVVKRVELLEGVRFQELFDRLPRRAQDGDAALAAVWQLVAEARSEAADRMRRSLKEFEPMLQRIAGAANDERVRPQIEGMLPGLEANGWKLSDPVHRIWAGERDPSTLTAELDDQDSQLVRRILELLDNPRTTASAAEASPDPPA
jgi:hypothetical protein